MKILKLSAENVKKVKAVEITPTGDLIQITGRNGQGKSSILDAMWWALVNAKHVQAVPIRKGASHARVKLELGDAQPAELIVEKHFTAKGATLTVQNAMGARFPSPQSMLDALLGALSFDPLAFVNQSPAEQFQSLRRIVPLEVDVDALDLANQQDFNKRTELNRAAKQLRAQLAAITVPDGTPEAPVDTDALLAQMADASRHNTAIGQQTMQRQNLQRQIDHTRAEADLARKSAADLRARAAVAEQDAAALDTQAASLEAVLTTAEALPTPVDVEALRAALTQAQATNAHVAKAQQRATLLAEATATEAQADALTAAMAERTKQKTDAIAKAAMPVPGLGFGDGVVTYDGVPFDQAESSAQIRVGVAIAMAANPKLKVIRIKEGSFLDDNNVALIAQMAHEHGYQVWMERVDASGKVGVVIEDGSVVAVNESAQA